MKSRRLTVARGLLFLSHMKIRFNSTGPALISALSMAVSFPVLANGGHSEFEQLDRELRSTLRQSCQASVEAVVSDEDARNYARRIEAIGERLVPLARQALESKLEDLRALSPALRTEAASIAPLVEEARTTRDLERIREISSEIGRIRDSIRSRVTDVLYSDSGTNEGTKEGHPFEKPEFREDMPFDFVKLRGGYTLSGPVDAYPVSACIEFQSYQVCSRIDLIGEGSEVTSHVTDSNLVITPPTGGGDAMWGGNPGQVGAIAIPIEPAQFARIYFTHAMGSGSHSSTGRACLSMLNEADYELPGRSLARTRHAPSREEPAGAGAGSERRATDHDCTSGAGRAH